MIIAFSGASGSGVTLTSFKAAQLIYEITEERVIYVSLDEEIPTLGRLIGSRRNENIPGLQDLFERDNISREGIYRHIFIEEHKPNFGILGFTGERGEEIAFCKDNYFSKQNALEFIKTLWEMVPFVFVDCGQREDYLSSAIWEKADKRVVIANASPKGKLYYQCHRAPLDATDCWIVQTQNRDKENTRYLEHRFFKERPIRLGYCKKIVQQEKEGKLLESLPKSRYTYYLAKGLAGILHDYRQ